MEPDEIEPATCPATDQDPLAASADDFGATIMWRYPEGVLPVRAFDPEFPPAKIAVIENTGKR